MWCVIYHSGVHLYHDWLLSLLISVTVTRRLLKMQTSRHKSQVTRGRLACMPAALSGQVEDRQTDMQTDRQPPWPVVPKAAGRPVCYGLEEVMCESECGVPSSWPQQHSLQEAACCCPLEREKMPPCDTKKPKWLNILVLFKVSIF